MTLFKTSFLSFIATAVKLLAALVINKAIAIFIGPSGLALIGQFQNFIQLSLTFGQGGINQGVTKYTAENNVDEKWKLKCLFSTSFKVSLITSFIAGLVIIVSRNFLSVKFLQSEEYAYIFILFGLTIIFFVLNQLLLSILNGLKEIKLYVSVNIIQSLFSLVFTTVMIYFYQLDGILIALVTNQSFVFLFLIYKLRNHAVIKIQAFSDALDKPQSLRLFKFSLMALVSAVCVPISHLVIRDYLGAQLGWEAAGHWQAMWYISSMYLMVVTTTLSIYFLPKFSELIDKQKIKNELVNGYKLLIPAVMLMALIIYLIKDYIIVILFSNEFVPMKELFFWQLCGDVIKLCSWLLSYLMLAKEMLKKYVVTEIVFSVSFVTLALHCVGEYGLEGMSIAYFINYLIYFIVMAIIIVRFLKVRD
ncbi:O-antigen translocase [Shewanella sp. HL-SH8]|uniref:O-antigen translocase n=1 Tax=Shewanella sp. HL-SH8 TaxID=3436242 RepID=UPI003EBBC131